MLVLLQMLNTDLRSLFETYGLKINSFGMTVKPIYLNLSLDERGRRVYQDVRDETIAHLPTPNVDHT